MGCAQSGQRSREPEVYESATAPSAPATLQTPPLNLASVELHDNKDIASAASAADSSESTSGGAQSPRAVKRVMTPRLVTSALRGGSDDWMKRLSESSDPTRRSLSRRASSSLDSLRDGPRPMIDDDEAAAPAPDGAAAAPSAESDTPAAAPAADLPSSQPKFEDGWTSPAAVAPG